MLWCDHNHSRTLILILMEKLKRVNHNTLIFLVTYPKNVHSRRENVGNVGIIVCEREKFADYVSDSCQNPGEASCICREERKMV